MNESIKEVASNLETLPFIFYERTDIEMPDYPSNSDRTRNEKENVVQLADDKKVINGNAVIKKKTKSKLAKTLFSEDVDNVKNYISKDLIIPKIKEILYYTIADSMEMLLWGDTVDRSRDRGRGTTTYRNYTSFSDNRRSSPIRPTSKTDFNLDEIYLTSKGDGEIVIDRLLDILGRYPAVTVIDLYEALGMAGQCDYTAGDWGWTDLSSAEVIRRREGYMLKLPRPQYLR